MVNISLKPGLLAHSVEGKIYLLRKHHNIPQAVIAEIMRMRPEGVAHAEGGECMYTESQVAAAKKYFMIVGLPITERECTTFEGHLYIWLDHIRDRRLDEARVIQKELARIDNLEPCDFDTVMLCKLIELHLFRAEGDYATIEEKLNIYQKHLSKMNDKCLYHYYYCKGALLGHQGHYENSLDYFLMAYDMTEDNKNLLPREDAWLYYYIAWCYSSIEILYRSIFFHIKAKQAYAVSGITEFSLNIDRGLALNYIKMNQVKDAKRLLNKCMAQAESFLNDTYIGLTFLYLGFAHKKAENWVSAIENFDKAFGYLPENTDNYYSALYHKILCTIQAKTFAKTRKHLAYVNTLGCLNEKWVIYFTALGHYYTIKHKMTSYKNNASIAYIENIAIPHFIKEHDYFLAIEYYTLLEQHLKKIKTVMRSLSAGNAIKNIYMRCFFNHGRED
ncbi:MAG: hypothetical protein FWC73_05355 [Defluviitaleaceae bacterium]|nr:hypothetical protein [Defluviitaleaceae bacterium]